MQDDRENLAGRDDERLSAEEQYELWEWVRAAGVSAEDLRKALQRSEQVAGVPDGKAGAR